MLTKFVSAYFILFGAIYFTRFDVSPSTSYLWRFVLFIICSVCAVISIKDWKKQWTYLGFGIFFLVLVEIALTMDATHAYFQNPQNVDFFTYYAFGQDPNSFYLLGLKVRWVWFLIHALAAVIWLFNKPHEARNDVTRIQHKVAGKFRYIGGSSVAVFVLLAVMLNLPDNTDEEREMQEEVVPKSVAEVVINGKNCQYDQAAWVCEYQIGNDLKFNITNVNGVSHIEILNKGRFSESDYYLDLESLKGFTPLPGTSYIAEPGQGCLIIKVGEPLSISDEIYSKGVYAIGYISPEDGNVYSFENECSPAQSI